MTQDSQRTTAEAPDAATQQALHELHRYLSDSLAPLMVLDSLEHLMGVSPQYVAAGIQSWVAAQFRVSAERAPTSDYIFHALKKVHLLGELKLIPFEPLRKYMESLNRIMLEICPPEEREALAASLKSLGQVESELTPSVQVLHRQVARAAGGPGPAGGVRGMPGLPGGGAAVSEEVAQGLRRLALLMERIEKLPRGAAVMQAGGDAASPGAARAAGAAGQAAGGAAPQPELLAQLLATAAVSSRSGAEFEQYMQQLSRKGIDARTQEVFRALGNSLPGWALPAPLAAAAAGQQPHEGRQAEAMRRIVTMAPDPQEGARRFSEMVQAAVEQFNEGALGRAATMFDVALKLVADRKMDADLAKSVRMRAHESLSADQLRKAIESPEKHPVLKRVLDFFPALVPAGLLDELNGEERRDRRKLLLELLEVHGAVARQAAFERLESRLTGHGVDGNGFFERNLIYLLRRLPQPADAPWEKELEILIRMTGPANPLIIVKEALTALGSVKHDRAEQALISRLQSFEDRLLRGETAPHGAEELTHLLDRICSSLARLGTPNATRTLVNHALKTEAALGNTIARLDELSSCDLSEDRELVDHLVQAARNALPRRVLVFVVQKNSDTLMHIVRALTSTRTAPVRQLFRDLVEKFPDRDFAQVASRALAAPQAAPAAAAPATAARPGAPAARPAEAAGPSLAGDLDLFGLPNLFQTIADSRMTGALSLVSREGSPAGTVAFVEGKIRSCELGSLTGEVAAFQLFEKPVPGTFSFRKASVPSDVELAGARLFDVTGILLEALRRHDELQQSRALVPDDASLKPTGTKPTPPSEETDHEMLKAVWAKVVSGATASVCEGAFATDSYRIRRCLSHWLEEGALQAA